MFHLRVWSTSLPCLIVGGGIICGVQVFLSIFKMERSKENKIVELWKFNFKRGV